MLRLLQRLIASERWMRVLGTLSPSLRIWHPDVRRDPYPNYRHLRERGLVRMRLFGGWAAARYRDVERLLQEPAFSTNRDDVALMKMVRRATRGRPDFENLVDNNLLMIDGARHRRLRGLVSKAFTPRRVEALRPRVAALAEDLLDRMVVREEVDLIRDLRSRFLRSSSPSSSALRLRTTSASGPGPTTWSSSSTRSWATRASSRPSAPTANSPRTCAGS